MYLFIVYIKKVVCTSYGAMYQSQLSLLCISYSVVRHMDWCGSMADKIAERRPFSTSDNAQNGSEIENWTFSREEIK